jgi:formate-dependent nitrite reductase cytochrome c552 subunit
MVRGTILGDAIIEMLGVTATGVMPTTAMGYIGTDLRAHHPVGIEYKPTVTIAFGSGSRTIELLSSPTSPLKLYAIGVANYVECSSCHDPHLENQKFLRVTTGANLASKISATCNSCHDKTGWTGSIHQSSSLSYSDTSVSATFGTGTITSLACMNCHRTHKGLGIPYLLRQPEETTCFQGASDLTTETACHGSSATSTNRIQTVITRAYKHPTTTISGVHTNLDVLYPTEVGKGLDWAHSRHAECVDCHNPHRAKNTPARVGTSAWYPGTVDGTSNQTAKSGALTGVTGVQPTWPTIWTVPTTFTTQESSTFEYQICFKCHSYWALRDSDGITTYTTASGATVTDQAMEFNPNNKSAHPVVVTLNNQTGSYAPKALVAAQMSAPWATNVGNQTMYCSDCHGTDSENAGDPKGPHGSSFKYLLKGTGKYWPTKPDGTLWRLNTTDGANTALFCKNCHPIFDGEWKNEAHDNHDGRTYNYGDGLGAQSYPCVGCHSVIPHGMKRSRLIVYRGSAGFPADPIPYRYQPGTINYALLNQFKKTTPGAYDDVNCSTESTCGKHPAITGADP